MGPILNQNLSIQTKELVKLFGRGKRGFFIEAGAHNGYDISNTLYLEKVLRWDGILVEPNPDALDGRCWLIQIPLSLTLEVQTLLVLSHLTLDLSTKELIKKNLHVGCS